MVKFLLHEKPFNKFKVKIFNMVKVNCCNGGKGMQTILNHKSRNKTIKKNMLLEQWFGVFTYENITWP